MSSPSDRLVYAGCTLAAAAGGAFWLASPVQVSQPGAVFVWGSGLVLLTYGLARDVVLVFVHAEEEEPLPGARLSMTCFESLTGMTVVAIGLLLHGAGWSPVVSVPAGAVLAAAALIVAAGHATRDWVLILVQVPNHRNLIPTWRITRWDASLAAAVEACQRTPEATAEAADSAPDGQVASSPD